MAIQKVTVAGSGVLGSQIAFQSAFKASTSLFMILTKLLLKKPRTGSKISGMLIIGTLLLLMKHSMPASAA